MSGKSAIIYSVNLKVGFMKKLIFVLLYLIVANPSQGRIIIVDANGTGDYPTIQAAINAAADGDTVEVQPGRYTGNGNRDIDFKGKTITVKSASGPENCIIDCEGAGRGFYFHNGENANSVLDGLTIINGYATHGGGIYCFDSSPTIKKCTIKNNSTSGWSDGGGIYCKRSDVTITGCIVSNNMTNGKGGGISCWWYSKPIIRDCNIYSNSATHNGGGGISSFKSEPQIINCTINNNMARYGAGIFGDHDSESPSISNCIISGNTSDYNAGGGIQGCNGPITNCIITGNTGVYSGGGGLNRCNGPITNCIITNNSISNGDGGGIYRCKGPITNCIIANNWASDDGGGIDVTACGNTITNCTITGNTARGYGGGIYTWFESNVTVRNCILWNNSGYEIYLDYDQYGRPSIINLSYNDIEGGQASAHVDPTCNLNWGLGNIQSNPLFVNPANGDYHLQAGSFCINAGDDESDYNNQTDIDGDPRVIGNFVDIGADEYSGQQLAVLIDLTIEGPNQVYANSSTKFSAKAHYENGNNRYVDNSAHWGVEPNTVASINHGLLKITNIRLPQEIAIFASYSEGDVTLYAEMKVQCITNPGLNKMYWTDHGTDKIQRANLDGSNVETIYTVKPDDRSPRAIAVDGINGKVYWYDFDINRNGKIMRANLDGTLVEEMNIREGEINGIALDVLNNKIYWSTYGEIKRANLDGSEQERILEGIKPGGLDLDRSAGKVFWSDRLGKQGTRTIRSANTDGTNMEIHVTSLEYPFGMILDEQNGMMYWTNLFENSIQRAKLDGTDVEEIVVGTGRPYDISLDVKNNRIYWVDIFEDKIFRSNLDGTGVEAVVTVGLEDPRYVAILNFRNFRPIADAGPNQTIYAWIGDIAEVTLDGSGSYDEDGQPLTYHWSVDGNSVTSISGNNIINLLDFAAFVQQRQQTESAIGDLAALTDAWLSTPNSANWNQQYDLASNGEIITIELPVGEHTIELIVNDGVEDSEPNYAVINVIAPLETAMKFTPQTLNCKSQGRWVKGHLVLGEEYLPEDVNISVPFVAELTGVDVNSNHVNIYINDDGLVEVEAVFDRADFCSAAGCCGDIEVTVKGSFVSGQSFYGKDIIRIITCKSKHLAFLTSYWLESGADMDADLDIKTAW